MSNLPANNNNKPAVLGTKENADTLLKNMQPQFERALGNMIGAERFARMALTALNKNPKLFECRQSTVLASLMDCAQLGLIPNSPLKQASLVPYRNNKENCFDCQLIIEYGGYIALASRSDDGISISANVVYDCDIFKYQFGTNQFIQHIPALERPDGAKKIAVYAIVSNKGGGNTFAIMSPKEVEAIRNRSQNYKASKQYNFKTPWDTDEDEMFKKTGVRRVIKLVSLSPEYMEVIAKDSDNDYISPDQETRIPSTTINGTKKPDLSTQAVEAEHEDIPANGLKKKTPKEVIDTIHDGEDLQGEYAPQDDSDLPESMRAPRGQTTLI